MGDDKIMNTHGGKRRGSGRKPKPEGTARTVRYFRASDMEMKIIEEAATNAGLPTSKYIRQAALDVALNVNVL